MLRLLVTLSLLGYATTGSAADVRMLAAMPTAGKTTARALVKSKKAGFQCQTVRIGDNGNPVKVSGSRSYWFENVPDVDDKAADDQLGDGKKAVRCTLKQYDSDRSKMRNAVDVDEGA